MLAALVVRTPELLVASVDELDERMAEMSGVLFGGETEAAATVVAECPWLLLQSDRLRPLVDLMTQELGASLSQVLSRFCFVQGSDKY